MHRLDGGNQRWAWKLEWGFLFSPETRVCGVSLMGILRDLEVGTNFSVCVDFSVRVEMEMFHFLFNLIRVLLFKIKESDRKLKRYVMAGLISRLNLVRIGREKKSATTLKPMIMTHFCYFLLKKNVFLGCVLG